MRFDPAVAELNRSASGRDLLAVADRYQQLSENAAEFARAIEAIDRKSGLLPPARQRRERLSA